MMQIKNISVETLLTAFESSYDGIHILDRDGNTIYINDACVRIEGITKEEANKKNIKELVSDGVYSESVTLKVLETHEPVTIMQTVKNGNEVLTTGTPIFEDDGETVSQVIVNSRDITDLNALKRKLSAREREVEWLQIEKGKFGDVITRSQKMSKVIDMALKVSKVDSTVLITGKSGVGKGLLAELIHKNSSRSDGPFVKIDCSSIPESLFESELFGYEKGAFTGAERAGKMGLLEIANNGTVFLDEIGEMPLSMQPKIMRVIQDKEVISVGGKNAKALNIRFISATNANLEQMVADKLFREDLYYRLNVVPIHIPALKERREDIIPLIEWFANIINEKYGLKKTFSPTVKSFMIKYDWPGNVRQLENVIERMLVSSPEDVIDMGNVPDELQPHYSSMDVDLDLEKDGYRQVLARYDAFLLKRVLEKEGSVAKAARKTNMDPTTYRRKIKKYKDF